MNEETTVFQSGRIEKADRIQRLALGSLLMVMTLIGFTERVEWRGVASFVLQTELLVTGIIGWCPVYWACTVAEPRSSPSD